MAAESKRAVVAAIIGNAAIAVIKFIAGSITGSSAMISEGIHSLVDTGNGGLLYHGLRRGARPADDHHPFGHGMEVYFWSLIVAVSIFGIGGGMSIYEGIIHVRHPAPLENPTINYIVLALAAVVVWIVVIREVRPAYIAGRLVTGGLFAHVRNPIYSAFIFLECPGLALLLWSWPGLALPLVAYALYRRWIPLEEARLHQRFGAEYAAYRRRVPALVPVLRPARPAR